MRISVVGTVHVDTGAAIASEILAILLRINPQVIFLEMPASEIDDHFNGRRSNLESTAVSRYRELRPVELVPVDLPTPEPEFFRDFERLDRELQHKSREYNWLVRQDREFAERDGFAYLNSEPYRKLTSDLRAARLAALEKMGDRRLTEFYKYWTSVNERREEAMLKNIEAFCERAPFLVGVFLVGAAHRQSLLEKSAVHTGPASAPIEWDFDGFP